MTGTLINFEGLPLKERLTHSVRLEDTLNNAGFRTNYFSFSGLPKDKSKILETYNKLLDSLETCQLVISENYSIVKNLVDVPKNFYPKYTVLIYTDNYPKHQEKNYKIKLNPEIEEMEDSIFYELKDVIHNYRKRNKLAHELDITQVLPI